MLQSTAEPAADIAMPGSGPALRLDRVAKSFGPTRALRDASLELRRGEVHAIVGENGSGKSTLVKVLSGVHRPDAGSLSVGGDTVDGLGTPRHAAAAGIATVFQEVLVVEPRSALENIWLGTDGLFRDHTPKTGKRSRATAVLAELLETPPPLDAPVEALSLSDRQACCIARALVRDPRVVILDEATSALDVQTRDRLFAALRRRTAGGTSVVFISHRMDEIAEIADRCTVMRSGETVATLERGSASTEDLVRLMTGADHLTPGASRRRTPGDVVLRHGDFAVRAGELVGLAGLEGHGQDDFIKALWAVGSAAGARIAYVPRERRAEGIFESKSVRENFGLPTLAADACGGIISHARTRARLSAYVERLRIKLGDPEDVITTLSGGNQQKVVMARWLATDPALLLLNDPTRGVDLGAKRDLYDLLNELTEAGVAVVMLSSEVDEHVELMDRVLVFREGAPFCDIARDTLTREALVSAYFGKEPARA